MTALVFAIGTTACSDDDPIAPATSNGVLVNGANVLTTDVLASNGVVHVIDAVLIP